MVHQTAPDPDNEPPPAWTTRRPKRPKATVAAWVAVGIALAEVVVRIIDR